MGDNQASFHIVRQCLLKDVVKNLPEDVFVIKVVDAVPAERGGVRHHLRQPRVQESAVHNIDVNFFYQAVSEGRLCGLGQKYDLNQTHG